MHFLLLKHAWVILASPLLINNWRSGRAHWVAVSRRHSSCHISNGVRCEQRSFFVTCHTEHQMESVHQWKVLACVKCDLTANQLKHCRMTVQSLSVSCRLSAALSDKTLGIVLQGKFFNMFLVNSLFCYLRLTDRKRNTSRCKKFSSDCPVFRDPPFNWQTLH